MAEFLAGFLHFVFAPASGHGDEATVFGAGPEGAENGGVGDLVEVNFAVLVACRRGAFDDHTVAVFEDDDLLRFGFEGALGACLGAEAEGQREGAQGAQLFAGKEFHVNVPIPFWVC